MKSLYLYGVLAEKYGAGPHTFDAHTPHELIRALVVNADDEIDNIIRSGSWHFVAGPIETGNYLDESEIILGSSENEFHLLPVVKGSGGIGKIILGAVLIGIAAWFTFGAAGAAAGVGIATASAAPAAAGFTVLGMTISWSTVGMFGASLALSGIAEVMAGSPKIGDYSSQERPDNMPSFMFNGPVNTSTQGQPCPLVYGRFRVGSYVVSAGVEIEELPV